METFTAKLRSDKRARPETQTYRYLTIEECKHLGGHALAVDRHGDIATVKVTSVKTWKTRRDVRIGWKYGMYEYGTETLTDKNEFFVCVVEPATETA